MKKNTNTNNILDHHNDKYDIIIIGAGVSSLAAIQEIHMFNNNSKSELKRPIKYLILESNNRVGGRVLTIPWTIDNKHHHVDFGGTWLHGIVKHPFIVNNIINEPDIDLINISTNNFWTSKKIYNKHYDKYDCEINLYLTPLPISSSTTTTTTTTKKNDDDDDDDDDNTYANKKKQDEDNKTLTLYEKSIILGITPPPSIHNPGQSKKTIDSINDFTKRYGSKQSTNNNNNNTSSLNPLKSTHTIKIIDNDHGEQLKISIDKMFHDIYHVCLKELDKFHINNKIDINNKVMMNNNTMINYDDMITMDEIFNDYFILLKDLFYVNEEDLQVLKWVVKCHEIWFGCTMEYITCKEWIDTSPPPPLSDNEEEDGKEDDDEEDSDEAPNSKNDDNDNKNDNKQLDGSNWGDLPGPHAIIKEGVGHLITKHLNKFEKHIKLNHKVIEINFKNRTNMIVTVDITNNNSSSSSSSNDQTHQQQETSPSLSSKQQRKQQFETTYILNTIPLSLYKTIKYKPYFPRDKIQNLDSISMTNYFKVFLGFQEKNIFWDKNITWIGNVNGGNSIANPYIMFFNYYKFTKAPILVGFAYGDIAKELECMGMMKSKPLSPVRPIVVMDPGDDRVGSHSSSSSSSSSKDDLKNLDDNRIGRRHSISKDDINDITHNTTNNDTNNTNDLEHKSIEAPVLIALKTLENIYQITNLKFKLDSYKLTNWGIAKHSKGAYPFGIPTMTKTKSNVDDANTNKRMTNIYFSGDGVTTNNDEGSLAAAYDTGQTAMKEIINTLKHDLLIEEDVVEEDLKQVKKYRSPTKKKSPSSTRNHTSKLSPIEMKERERRMKKGISEGQKLVILS